jgi:hypothetical protein
VVTKRSRPYIDWMYLKDPSDFAELPKEMWLEDDHALWTYTIAPPVTKASTSASWMIASTFDPMPIVTAVNFDRPSCATRAVNQAFTIRHNRHQKSTQPAK